jgi:CDGSH-type Zn-finger protein/uncharacterized Fe-S cluster protein YjdI
MSKTQEVRGQNIVVRFEGERCIHSRNCVLSLPDVFVANVRGEWIHPDQASPEEIAALAHTCPSGAITYERLDGGPNEQPPELNVLRLRENGPLALHAPARLEGRDLGLRVTLCRCGASKRKPFCDGSHASMQFTATGEPPVQESAALAQRGGPIDVTAIPNGPLKLTGNLEIVSGTGRTVQRCTEAFLCRCGSSGRKPYCDGTHKKIGFKSD